MPSKSKSQQRLMGMALSCKRTGKCASDMVEKMSKSMSEKQLTDFAKTPRKGLPVKVKKKK